MANCSKSKFWHVPVMVEEVLNFLKCKPEGCYIDGTIGGGGHADVILKASAPSGRLFGIDKDSDAISQAQERLAEFGDRVTIVQGAFSKIHELIKISCADGILLDLGVSSYQLDSSSRGFGFREEGILDMRMDSSAIVSAADIIKEFDEQKLANIIFEYGEERYSRQIARAIVKKRQISPILTTHDLAAVVLSSMPAYARKGKIHPATRTFQALRIFINDELGELHRFLDAAPKILCSGARLLIISYHSLEDRIVKRAFKAWELRGGYKVITKKVIRPSADECYKNPRSRSAKLRVLERQ